MSTHSTLPSLDDLEAAGMTLFEAGAERHRLFLAMSPADQYQECLHEFERILDWEREMDVDLQTGSPVDPLHSLAAERRADIIRTIDTLARDHAIPPFRPGQVWSGKR